MMHGDSSHHDDDDDDDEVVDILVQGDLINGISTTTARSIVNDSNTSRSNDEKDLTAAITAALSDDDDDNDDYDLGCSIGDPGDDDDDTEELVNFLAAQETSSELNAFDEAMNLMRDEPMEEDVVVTDFTAATTSAKTSVGNNHNCDDDATQASNASLSSIALATEEEERDGVNDDGTKGKESKNTGAASPEQVQMVPIQQFENALMLIQDLEKQVDSLEAAKQQLQVENTQLRQESQTQQMLITSYEKKLAEFPRLMEATVEEQSAVAAEVAKGAAKQSFWNEYMSRQEELTAQEMEERRRTATTTSLKQSDFLKNVVERQEKEKSSSVPSSFLQGWKSKFAPASSTRNGSKILPSGKGANSKVKSSEEDDTGIAADDSKKPGREDAKIFSLLT